MMLIDTHCHLSFENFDVDRAQVIARAKAAGVSQMISIGCRLPDAEKTLEIAAEYSEVFAAVSIHPADIETATFVQDFEQISELAKNKKVLAIGETGLDLYRTENPPLQIQQEAFQRHFELAKRLQKPLIIHSRAAREQTLAMLRTFGGHPFVWHCFSEDLTCAQEVIALGGLLSFTGVVTFPQNEELQNVAREIPLEKIMVETDAPFLAPVPHRGKRCEPAFVIDTAKFLADLRTIPFADFAVQTTQTAQNFFNLP